MTTQLEHNLTFGTKSGQFGPSDDLFMSQKAGCVTIGGSGISLLKKQPFLSLQKAPVAQKWVSYANPVMPGTAVKPLEYQV